MLSLTVTNRVETQHLAHPTGPLEVGRGPSRDGVPRVIIRDAFVSRDHVRLEEADGGRPTVVAAPETPRARPYFEMARRTAAALALRARDRSALFPKIVVEDS